MKTDVLLNKVNDEILELMETHGQDWSRPWVARLASGMPCNAVSKREYSGINIFITTWMSDHESRYWATYKQWQDLGAQVRKGEKSTHIFYLAPYTPKDAKLDKNGEPKKAFVNRCYSVFNADQVDGWDDPDNPDERPDAVEFDLHAQEFINRTNATIFHGGERAFFRPSEDFIQIPDVDRFKTTEGYYSTVLHELTHWTGHKSRLDRTVKEPNRVTYAKEELVAEVGSAYLCEMFGFKKEALADHAKYLNHWIELIKDDKKAMMTAFSRASKAVKYLTELQEVKQAA